MYKPIVALTALLLAACSPDDPATQSDLRLAVMTFMHETCTFCPGGDTTIGDWTRLRGPLVGDDVLSANPYVEGFVAAAAEYRGIELIGLESPAEVFGGSSRSWNTQEAFDHFMAKALDDLEQALPVDGVYLALHGAMAVRNVPRPEAEIARRIRQVVGPDVPIVGSFDLHGNEDEEFLRWADMAFATKRYPHYDAGLQGARAARALVRLARGTYEATTATRRPGIVTPTVVQWTGQSPAMDIMERARRWEAREKDVFVSVLFGFPWSDVPDIGATVHVMTNRDQALADHIADDMSAYIWRVREQLFGAQFPQPAEAVAWAGAQRDSGATPVVLADYSDRSGDATHILREIVEQRSGKTLIATIRDESALDGMAASDAGPGTSFARDIGGFAGEASGTAVRIEGTVLYLGAGLGFERIAAIEFGDGNVVILTPALKQVTAPGQLRFGSLEPDDFEVFVVKSRVHFRRGFDETGYARAITVVDAPGPYLGTVHLDALPFENVALTDFYPYRN